MIASRILYESIVDCGIGGGRGGKSLSGIPSDSSGLGIRYA